MAGQIQLSSLLTGPTTHLEHDETGDGSFKDLTGSLPLHMLTYFSMMVRDEYLQQSSKPRIGRPCDCSRSWFRSHRQDCHRYAPLPPEAPRSIRIIGGDATAHLDLVHWMTTCCHHNRILPMSATIASPTRIILALKSVRLLGVACLEHEIPQLVKRLENEMLDIETVGKVFASGDNVLPVIREAICTCIAGFFYAGKLLQLDRWMHLAKMNRKFDVGVWKVLERRADKASVVAWEMKDALRIAAQYEPRQQWGFQGQPLVTQGQYPMPYPYANPVHGHHAAIQPPFLQPAHPTIHPPMQPARPPSGAYLPPQPTCPPVYQYPPQAPVPYAPSVQNASGDRQASWNTTSSSSSSTNDDHVPDPRRVRFDDTPRGPRAPTPPPPMWHPGYPAENGMQPYPSQHPMPAPAHQNPSYGPPVPTFQPFPQIPPQPPGSFEYQAGMVNENFHNVQWNGPQYPMHNTDPYARERVMEFH